jgi:hypothetical protein
MNIVTIIIFLLFVLGAIIPRSKFVSLLIFLFIWILNINISNPDYIPLREAYETEPYGEIGYRYLCELFFSQDIDFLVFRLGIVAISLLLFYRFIIHFSELPAFVSAIYLINCPLDFVQFRNFFSFTLLVNAIPLLGQLTRKNIILYMTALFIAGSIHASIFLFIIAFVLQKDLLLDMKKTRGSIVMMCLLLLPLLYYLFFIFVDEEVTARSQAYFVDSTSIITKSGVLFLCSFVYYVVKRYNKYSLEGTINPNSPKSWVVYNPNRFVITLSFLFVLLIPVIMFNITYLRLLRFVLFVNVVYMLNVIYYTKKGSFIVVFCYSLLSLLIGFVLHRNTFTNEVVYTFLNENLILK